MNDESLFDVKNIIFNKYIDISEFDSQGFELIFTDYYNDVYGENDNVKKFKKIIEIMESIMNNLQVSFIQIGLFQNIDKITPEQLLQMMQSNGVQWYKNNMLFRSGDIPVRYVYTMFAALQVYDTYIHDKDAGLKNILR